MFGVFEFFRLKVPQSPLCIVFNRTNVIITRRNMIKSYLIDGKSISSKVSQYRGTALRAISRFGES